ncbi:MAG: type I-B CRISPR-associated protein Cas7/Cst2/DevR [Caldilineaceae bacterium]|nr:type I-B CRISPR-associated protein Cas7/Cst2/DevR [Caldilineaceae bacterium]
MSFITGLLLIDAPASALNNAGGMRDELYGNKVAVKAIRAEGKTYPYVSAQAFRYWLRSTLEAYSPDWKSAPVYREEKVAYTDANPIKYWDDDLFGYMRAPGTGKAAKKKRQEDTEYKVLTPLDVKSGEELSVTRISPFRVSTLVSVAPALLVEDWESMSRLDEHPIPYSSQFYRTTLKGLFSLDLQACGTFSYRNKTGFRNLDDVRVEQAHELGLTHLEDEKSYRLPADQRVERIATLLDGMARLEGGAKQTLHYTDVTPALVILAVTKGGNHIFGHVVGATGRGLPTIKINALAEALSVFKDEILSTVYVGWVQGYLDDERTKFETAIGEEGELAEFSIKLSHPRIAFQNFIQDIRKPDNSDWLG